MNKKDFNLQKKTLKQDASWVADEWKKIIIAADLLTAEDLTRKELDRTALDLSRKLNYLLAKLYIQDKILEELKKFAKDA